MPKYVIQEHHLEESIHYDLMLESENYLRTWRMPKSLETIPQDIEQLPDHRKIYLEYEGEISGNRGFVKIKDKGEYSIITWTDKLIEILLTGEHCNGIYRLTSKEEPFWNIDKENNLY